jgi:hypothetical protein
MIIAIPAVKPIITGFGIYLTSEPALHNPSTMRISPAIKVAIIRLSNPYCVTIPSSIGTNAPVGPAI